jgi:hypothetical protein
MVDAAYSRQKQGVDAAVRAGRRLIIPLVTALVLIGGGWMTVWAFSGSKEVVGAVAKLVGIEVGVVSGVINLESSGVEASDWRLRHEATYHEA